MTQDSEFQQLLALARQGDREAIGRIYIRYVPHMERVTRYRLRRMGLETTTTPADIGNSVFRQLLKPGAFDKITSDKHLRNFLLKACGNKATDILSKLTVGRHDLREMAPLHEVENHSQTDLVDPLEHAEELDRIYSQLPPRLRLLCTLRRGGCEWDEIAQRLNTTSEVARQAFSRGFRRARKLVAESRRGEK